MIGPHQGKELELMLAGTKPLAFFHDVVPEGGIIPEEIIPEQAFAPFVAQGKIKRFAEDFRDETSGHVIRYVCFALPGEEWRAQFLLWYKREFMAGRISYDPAHEYIIGSLLGYNAADIEHFLENQKSRRAKRFA